MTVVAVSKTPPVSRIARHTTAAVAVWAALVAVAAPSITGPARIRFGIATVVAIGIGLAAIAFGFRTAERISWRMLLTVTFGAAAVWAVALALIDGTSALTAPLRHPADYFAALPGIDSPRAFLAGFTERVGDYPIHVNGHPPGTVLVLWSLGRIGLGGYGWAAAMFIAAGASVVVSALVALREVAGEPSARRAAPFLAFAPAAVWIATSADALYAGVGALAVALCVVATGRRGARSHALAAAGGVAFGAALMLSYGMILLALIPAAVIWKRSRFDVAGTFAAAALAVLAAFAAAGFWWPAGLAATRRAYFAGVAARRGYAFFLIANIGAFGLACGPAVAAALTRLRTHAAGLLVAAAVAAVALADLSGLSKGEVERIWLPFAAWLLIATASLPSVSRRAWLGAQLATALAVQTFIATAW